MKLVLLHDTDETDFAGDVLGFLHALGLEAGTVMLAPNAGRTLDTKERDTLNQADGYIFLLTPGSERHGQEGYASQSVCDEMGRAEERFKNDLSKVIYLADSKWKPHAISQKAYVPFDRSNHRSMTRAFRDLAKELKAMGVFKGAVNAQAPLTIAQIAEKTPSQIKAVCAHIASLPNAIIRREVLVAILKGKAPDHTVANILRSDLVRQGWIVPIPNAGSYRLSSQGLDLVKYERSRPPRPFSRAGLFRIPPLPPYPAPGADPKSRG